MGNDKMDLIEEGGSHHNVPKEPPAALSSMTKEEWLREYGSTLSSERHFLERDPDWVQDKKSWWYRVTGRDGEEPPLWMQEEVRTRLFASYALNGACMIRCSLPRE